MHPSSWLDAAFGSEARTRVLRFLVKNRHRAWTEREIAAQIRMSSNAVNKAIRALDDAGFVTVHPIGRAHAVRVADGPALALQRVFEAERGVWDATLRAIRESLPKNVACYLFGSSASDSAKQDSDVDLLVIAADREAAADAIHAIHVKGGGQVSAKLNVISLTASEAAQRLKRPGVVQEAIRRGRRISDRSIDDVVPA